MLFPVCSVCKEPYKLLRAAWSELISFLYEPVSLSYTQLLEASGTATLRTGTQENVKAAIKQAKNNPKLKHLSRFHHYLQVSVSHRVLKEQNAERLMLKYYEYLYEHEVFRQCFSHCHRNEISNCRDYRGKQRLAKENP